MSNEFAARALLGTENIILSQAWEVTLSRLLVLSLQESLTDVYLLSASLILLCPGSRAHVIARPSACVVHVFMCSVHN